MRHIIGTVHSLTEMESAGVMRLSAPDKNGLRTVLSEISSPFASVEFETDAQFEVIAPPTNHGSAWVVRDSSGAYLLEETPNGDLTLEEYGR